MVRRLVLQLNPHYEPTAIVSVREALKKVCLGKALVIVSTGREIYPGIAVPSVIRIVRYKKVGYVPPRAQRVSRKNIIARDGSLCMYCGHRFDGSELELEHVIPRCQGGRSVWDNLVAACRRCNGRKGGRTPEQAGMKLIRRPLPATLHTQRYLLRQLGSEVEEWGRFLYHDSEGEQALVARG